MSSIDAMIDVDAFSNWINLKTAASKKCLSTQLHDWKYDEQKLMALSAKFNRFKTAFEKDPIFYGKCHELFAEIAEIEKKLDHLIYSNSELEKESYNEILFFKPFLQPLNFVPFFLSIWSLIRVYILPGMSLLFPIFILIAPYIILKFLFQIPITFNNYTSILHSMVTGNFKGITDPNAAINFGESFRISPFKVMKQFGIVIVTCIQGFIQPYWTYKHLRSIDDIIKEHGNLVIRFREIYESLETLLSAHGFTFFPCPLPDIQNERDATARIILESNYFKIALKYVGSLEVIMNLASKKELHPVHWVKSSKPVFRISDSFDFQVPAKTRKTISVDFEKPHAFLTGPNKGGKSTVLRALTTSALLAHTYGCTFGKATMTPFYKLFVCLKPDDLPGSKSRFEREIEFTASTLTYDHPILIFIDELYHSTNPPDALRSCNIYCEQLWKKPNVVSVISTHLFELVEKSNEHIQRLCCPAHTNKEGDIEFEYSLKQGICKVSSVDTLLRMNGLMKMVCAQSAH